ncbi:MAG: diaminopimelate decarboxylase [Candidatus Acidiferrales bacterium]
MPRRGKSADRLGPIDPTEYTACFEYRNGRLRCEEVALDEIAERAGTPTYVYSRGSIEGAYRRFDRALRAIPHTICYSVKANSNLAVLRALARLGSSFDIVSGGELERLRRIGVAAKRIVFSGVGKTSEEIREALRAGILLFNVESEEELGILEWEAARLRRIAPAALRVNPDVEAGAHPHISTGHHRHKFGVDWEDAGRLYVTWRGSRWISWQGISAHIGSQILDLSKFDRAVSRMAAFVRKIARAGVELDYFDFGGGLGIRYTTEKPPKLEAYARTLVRAVRPLGCRLLLEPGRSLAGPAGILLTRVLYTKRSRGKNFVVVDAAMNDLIRPALYGAVHPITRVMLPLAGAEIHSVDVVGPVCETGDCFLKDWAMPEVEAGDLLAIWNAGAYGFVMASQYNSRPRPAEVIVEGRRFRVVRRRESRADLLRGE